MKQKTYEEVVETISSRRRFGTLAGAEITAQMLKQLGHPQRGMRLIHIAGTNGKGSVSAFLCEILTCAGFRTGLFTSPHLINFEERIRVGSDLIPRDDVARIGSGLLAAEFPVQPSMFDYCLAMALLYFKEQACDVVILETGLGGRLDSTNAVGIPDVSVITKIGYDHMAVLGDTLEEIAAEKAGIIKKETRLILESQTPEVAEVITAFAREQGVTWCRTVDPSEITDMHYENGEQECSFGSYRGLRMRMLGVHQCENAAAAILAAEAFFDAVREKGENAVGMPWSETGRTAVKLQEEIIRKGIAQARWKGRMEILRESPFFLIDGAHNSNGVAALKDSLEEMFPGEKFHFVMGVMADKDYEKMVEELLPLAIDFRTVTVENDRAMQAEQLAEYIRGRGIAATSAALTECIDGENGQTEKTVAFGSLYFVGEIEDFFINHYDLTPKFDDYDKNDTF